MTNGSERNFSTGFTVADTRPRISATASSGRSFSRISAVPEAGPANRMPSNSHAAAARAMALVISQLTMRTRRS